MTTTKVQTHCVFAFVVVREPKHIVFSLLYCYDRSNTLCFCFCIATTGQTHCILAFVSVGRAKHIVFLLLYYYDEPNTSCFRNCMTTVSQTQCFLEKVVVQKGKKNRYYWQNELIIKINATYFRQTKLYILKSVNAFSQREVHLF